jgi:two-component system cell cycle sensor histidine kinase/response regulator CckA
VTVLLVEDDPDVRALLGEVLSIGGFAVLEAADGTEALRIAETTLRPIETLVTDINMPGINGLELARRVQVLRPAISVLYMSGAPADVVAAWGLAPGTAFLPKPFDADVFLDRVRDVMKRVQVGERAGAAWPWRVSNGSSTDR